MNVRELRVDGFRLQYILEGSGTPTLVIGSALYYARTFSSNLRSRLRMVFVDHRGFAPGNSDHDVRRYEMDCLLDDLEAVRRELGFDRFVLIGHSGHAFIALEYAKKYPDHVSHLVLLCSSPDYSAASHAAGDRWFDEAVCPERKAALAASLNRLPEALAAAPQRAFVTYCLLMGPKSWYDPSFDASALWEGIEVNMTMFDHVWGELFRDIDITRNLDRLAAPVFLGLGRFDYLVPPAYFWERVRPAFRNLTVRVFDRSSHAPFYEEPDVFDRELVSWIQQHSVYRTC